MPPRPPRTTPDPARPRLEGLERRDLPSAPGLFAQFFNDYQADRDAGGDQLTHLALTAVDTGALDHAYAVGVVPPGLDPHAVGFSARWTGELLVPRDDLYTFHTESDDGVRVFLDGRLVIDNFTAHPQTGNDSPAVRLEAGAHALIVEYFQFDYRGPGVVRLSWSAPGMAREVIPAAAYRQPPTVAGSVYLDADANGRRDGGEAGVGGVTVTLDGTTTRGEEVRRSTLTAADGSYAPGALLNGRGRARAASAGRLPPRPSPASARRRRTAPATTSPPWPRRRSPASPSSTPARASGAWSFGCGGPTTWARRSAGRRRPTLPAPSPSTACAPGSTTSPRRPRPA